MPLNSASRNSFGADVRALKHVNRSCPYEKHLLVSKRTAAYLPEDSKQEWRAMKLMTGRRHVLRTFALTLATTAIAGAAAATKPAAAAVGPVLTPPGAPELQQVGFHYAT
jgi:hypothetical protein